MEQQVGARSRVYPHPLQSDLAGRGGPLDPPDTRVSPSARAEPGADTI